MTKKEIVKQISEEKGLTQLLVKEIVQMTFDAIIDTLIDDPRHRIELRNFGVFEVKERAARTARNPRTGERVEVPAKFVVTFKPGKEMEERVLELEQAKARLTSGGVVEGTPPLAGGRPVATSGDAAGATSPGGPASTTTPAVPPANFATPTSNGLPPQSPPADDPNN